MSPKMPSILFWLILIINFGYLGGDEMEWNHAQIIEDASKSCNLLRRAYVNERNKWKENNGEVTIPVGWHNCLLYNLSSGFRGDKELLKQPPPPTMPGGKLEILVEKFEVEHADEFEAAQKLDILLHLVLSWEDKRLAQMVKVEDAIELADFDWIWTPTLINEEEGSLDCPTMISCFTKKVGLDLLPNHRVRALYTLRLREGCQIDYSNFPTKIAICEHQIWFVPEKDLLFQCQNVWAAGLHLLDEEDHEFLLKRLKTAVHIRAGANHLGAIILAEAKRSKKWQPEENSIACGPAGNAMTLNMRIIKDKGPISSISICAISLLAIVAFCYRRDNAKMLTALAFLFVTMNCLFMASLQYPIHGFPNGPPKILKFYNAAFFIASANLLCFLIVQTMKKIDNDIFPFPFPYRWLLLAKFLNELPGKLFKWRPTADERLVDDSADVGHGEDVEIVEMGNGNRPNSAAGNGNGNEAASNSEMWILLDKLLASILAFCFAYIFIWTIG